MVVQGEAIADVATTSLCVLRPRSLSEKQCSKRYASLV